MAIIRVDNDAIGSNNGTSWNNAYTNLQDAIAAAQSGDEIWVAKGTYRPTNGTDRNVSFILKDGVKMYGGFAGNETNLNQRNVGENETILSGDLGTQGNNQDNSYHVVNVSNTTESSILNGFTITDGNANNLINNNDNGGGIYSINSQAVLSNLIVSNNAAENGGGIYSSNSDGQWLNNISFVDNIATKQGGAIHSSQSDLVVDNVILNGNFAKGSGGGIYNSSSDYTISNSEFNANLSSSDGGAIYSISGSINIEDASFLNNGSLTEGGAIYNSSGSTPILNRVIFKNNLAKNLGGAIYSSSMRSNQEVTITNSLFENNVSPFGGGIYSSETNTTVTNSTFTNNESRLGAAIRTRGAGNIYSTNLVNNVIWNNKNLTNSKSVSNTNSGSTIINNSLVEGGYDGNNIINVSPQFVNPDVGDFRLANNSPAINAGDNSAISDYSLDLVGSDRIANGTVDLGAYEGLGDTAPVIPSLSNGQVIYVDDTAVGGNNGNSWANAYTDLQTAIANAPFGSQIWVAEGTYKPTSQTGVDARNISFNLKNGVAIYGGFAGSETNLAERDIANNPTILSGDIGIANDRSDNSRRVVRAVNVSSATILNGFTISDGNANLGASDVGGGIYSVTSQAIFGNLTIQNNTASNEGGGAYIANSSNRFTNVSFLNNDARSKGGAIYSLDSHLILQNSVFRNNEADVGGAVYNYNNESSFNNALVIDGALFENNIVDSNGGAIYNYTNSKFNINNAVFRNNKADLGGAIHNGSTDNNSTITNSIFDSNTADIYGGAIYNANSAAKSESITFFNNQAVNGAAVYTTGNNIPAYSNSIFWSNQNTDNSSSSTIFNDGDATTTIIYSIVEDGYNGLGNSNTNPQFNNPEQGDFRLKGNSPAINAGLNDFIIEDTDLIGNSRIVNNRVDLGAYEYFAEQDLSSHPGTISDSDILVSNISNPTVHRFFRADTGSHFYTASEVERQEIVDNLPHYAYEGASYQAAADSEVEDPLSGAKPVYRFFNQSTGVHLYTISEVERDYIIDNLSNYTFENVAYHAYDTPQADTVELYRFYQTQGDFHFFTPSVGERDHIVDNLPHYRLEGNGGVAFYVHPVE